MLKRIGLKNGKNSFKELTNYLYNFQDQIQLFYDLWWLDNFSILVIIKFPTYEKALEWHHSEEYKQVKDIRLQNSKESNIIFKGL